MGDTFTVGVFTFRLDNADGRIDVRQRDGAWVWFAAPTRGRATSVAEAARHVASILDAQREERRAGLRCELPRTVADAS